MEEEAIAGGQWNRVKDCEKRFLPFARKFRFVKIEFETADGIFMGEGGVYSTDFFFFGTNLIFEDPVVFFSRVSSFTTRSFFSLFISFFPLSIILISTLTRRGKRESSRVCALNHPPRTEIERIALYLDSGNSGITSFRVSRLVDGSASGWSDRFPRQTLGIENCASEGRGGGEREVGARTTSATERERQREGESATRKEESRVELSISVITVVFAENYTVSTIS